jgi:hypothetical protein
MVKVSAILKALEALEAPGGDATDAARATSLRSGLGEAIPLPGKLRDLLDLKDEVMNNRANFEGPSCGICAAAYLDANIFEMWAKIAEAGHTKEPPRKKHKPEPAAASPVRMAGAARRRSRRHAATGHPQATRAATRYPHPSSLSTGQHLSRACASSLLQGRRHRRRAAQAGHPQRAAHS